MARKVVFDAVEVEQVDQEVLHASALQVLQAAENEIVFDDEVGGLVRELHEEGLECVDHDFQRAE